MILKYKFNVPPNRLIERISITNPGSYIPNLFESINHSNMLL